MLTKIDKIIISKCPRKAYSYITNNYRNLSDDEIRQLQNIIVESKKEKYIRHLAYKNIKNVNTSLLEDALIEIGDFDFISFIKSVNDANIQKLEKAAAKYPGRAYEFARYVAGANIEKLQKAVLASIHCSYHFAKDIPGADIEKLQSVILKDPEYSYHFAKHVKGANVELLEKHMGKYLEQYHQDIIRDIIE